jgi:hypothetical protein
MWTHFMRANFTADQHQHTVCQTDQNNSSDLVARARTHVALYSYAGALLTNMCPALTNTPAYYPGTQIRPK